MRIRAWTPLLCVGMVVFVGGLAALAFAGEAKRKGPADAKKSPTSDKVLVLNTYGIWRIHCTIEPPVVASGKSVTLGHAWLNHKTEGPAADWMNPDFDDRHWSRGPVTLVCRTAMLARACLRGKFTVTDPAAVKDLSLSVGYRGGLVVYVNGKEVKREHVAPGKSLADGPAGEDRALSDLPIPSNLLRKGLNVIGLEVVRAPYPEETEDKVYEQPSCQLLSARLVAPKETGLVPCAFRPKGLQAWNADALTTDLSVDFGNPAEELRPVEVVGAKNGAFTGKLMLGSTSPIKNLKVTPGELKGPGGGIPAANIMVRYGILWGENNPIDTGNRKIPSPYALRSERLGALAEKPLPVFDVIKPPSGYYGYVIPEDAAEGKSDDGAVVPVWLTVKVPAQASPGTYKGEVKIEAQGEKTITVPIELRVADWTLPDTQGLHTFVDLIQCPDTSALEYDVPLWSEKHWEMIANAFRRIGETGSRTVYIPLIAHTNLGNEESFVRWIEKGGNKYDYDFSIMDRYLDTAEKNMGKPKQVIFVVWDVYMVPEKDANTDEKIRSRQKQNAEYILKTSGKLGSGPMVTVVDPATKKTKLVELPTHFKPDESRPLWKPLMDAVRERMKQRGLEKAMMLGLEDDVWASKEEIALFNEMTNHLPWVMQSHEGVPFNTKQYGIGTIGYQDVVWTVTFTDDNAERPKGYRGGIESHMGWARPDLVGQFDRVSRETATNVFWSRQAEAAITGSQRGNGRLGADYWKVVKDKKGKRVGRSHDRYPESTWRNLFIPESLLAPGPDGPVASDRLEAYRQGVQECEARIVLEYALDRERKKMGEDLAKRCEAYLAKRHMELWISVSNLQLYLTHPDAKPKPWGYMAPAWRQGWNVNGSTWYLGSNRLGRTEELFTLAGEVTKKIGPLPADVSKPGNWSCYERDHKKK